MESQHGNSICGITSTVTNTYKVAIKAEPGQALHNRFKIEFQSLEKNCKNVTFIRKNIAEFVKYSES
jgi:hypothetical protein